MREHPGASSLPAELQPCLGPWDTHQLGAQGSTPSPAAGAELAREAQGRQEPWEKQRQLLSFCNTSHPTKIAAPRHLQAPAAATGHPCSRDFEES